MANGLVMRAGGSVYDQRFHETIGSTADVNLFDPSSGTWTSTTEMPERLYGHVTVPLADGRVLVAGGIYEVCGSPILPGCFTQGRSQSFLFDPSTETWSPTGDLRVPRFHATGIALTDGSALLIDGGEAERFDPVARCG